MIIVPTDTPGFDLVRNISVMGDTGHGHASHGEVLYQSCRVPSANLLGGEGDGFVIAQERLGPGASTTACAGSASPGARST